MKNQILKILKKTSQAALILLLALSIANCSKDDNGAGGGTNPPVAAEPQNPLEGFLSATGLNQNISEFISIERERGLSFIPLVNGKMTAIVVKIAKAKNRIRVLIWDKASNTLLRTELIDVPTAGQNALKNIEALNLVKDKEYIICFSGGFDSYEHRRNNSTDVPYPITVGDIKITGYCQADSSQMPSEYPTFYYRGNCSFIFQK